MKKKLTAILLSCILAVSGVVPIYAQTDFFTSSEKAAAKPASKVVIDKITYVYDSATDSYVVQKGDNRRNVTLTGTIGNKNVTSIKNGAFANCTQLESIFLPWQLEEIESQAFLGCYNLGFVHLEGGDSLKHIASDAFLGVECAVFFDNWENPSPVLADFAKSHAFRYIEMDVHDDFWEIGTVYCINYQTLSFASRSLTGIVKVSIEDENIDYLREISHHAFRRCNKITEIHIGGENVQKIGDYAFADCTSLHKIILPKSITEISPTAFSGSNSVVIYSGKGSYVEKYARENHIPFKIYDSTTVATPDVPSVKVTGNKASVVCGKDVTNAEKYQYGISKNSTFSDETIFCCAPNESPDFRYLPKGTYYAFCRGIRTDINGDESYGSWSFGKKFRITATTPSQPKITKVSVSGNTVKVTYTRSSNAIGYDVVLGKRLGLRYGETRPLDYGKLVAKSTSGSTVTVTFRNVPKGTYYAGLHAYNRTSENRSKVFSPWSKAKKITIR